MGNNQIDRQQIRAQLREFFNKQDVPENMAHMIEQIIDKLLDSAGKSFITKEEVAAELRNVGVAESKIDTVASAVMEIIEQERRKAAGKGFAWGVAIGGVAVALAVSLWKKLQDK